MDRKRTLPRLLSGLFLIALAVRLIAVWAFPETHLGTNALIAYLGGAQMLVEGRGFADPSFPVFTPPLYAMFIAASTYIFGVGELPVRILQALADSLTVVLTFLIADRIFERPTAFLSSVLLILYPFSIYPVTYIGPETLFTFLLSLSLLLAIYAVTYQRANYYVEAGLLLGLATLMRGTTQFYPFFWLILLLAFHTVTRNMIRGYVAFCLCFALVIVPWTIRNYVVLREFVPVATTGSVFLQGSSEKFFTISGKRSEFPGYFEELKSRGLTQSASGTSVENDRFLWRAGLENYRIRFEQAPLSFVPFMLTKFSHLWYATESGKNQVKILTANMPIYLLSLVGIVVAIRSRNTLSCHLLGIVLYFVLLHWISLPLFRYMVPVMPYLIIYAAFGIVVLWEYLRGRLFSADGLAVP